MSTSLHPYLNFDGNTEEAMTFYAGALGGTLEIHRFGDGPMAVEPQHKDRVMHATLKAADINLMASDTMPGQPVRAGTQVHLSVNFTDKDEQQRVWDRLAEGARVTMPLGDQFFGRFGMLVDKFGVQWMLHFNTAS